MDKNPFDKINTGEVSLKDYIDLDKKDPNAFWKLDGGHVLNILEEAIERIAELEKEQP